MKMKDLEPGMTVELHQGKTIWGVEVASLGQGGKVTVRLLLNGSEWVTHCSNLKPMTRWS